MGRPSQYGDLNLYGTTASHIERSSAVQILCDVLHLVVAVVVVAYDGSADVNGQLNNGFTYM